MTGPENGLNMNTGWYGMKGDDIKRIFVYHNFLLRPLFDYMVENPDTTEKVWGRYFNQWANDDMRCVHGSWINLENKKAFIWIFA